MRSRKSNKPSDDHNLRLKAFLDNRFDLYNRSAFVDSDPISIPHSFSSPQDIEISGLWTALLSWGQRKTIINKARELFDMMGNEPHAFVCNASESEQKQLMKFTHRTFQPTDTAYFLHFLREFYAKHTSLEEAFLEGQSYERFVVKEALARFHDTFFASEWAPRRTRKHVPTPVRGSACKRINMFLRWMVRLDDHKVDFGLWKRIPSASLMIPLDVHVHRVATMLGLLGRKQSDWKAVEELTANLRLLDADDPVKYDYALFGIGVLEGKSIVFDPQL